MHKIKVPVFLACQLTDEQTGGHCPDLADEFTGTKRKWFTFTNGAHIDSLDPATFNRWYDFLQLYVARQRARALAGDQGPRRRLIYQTAMGIPGVTLPDDPIQAQPDFAAALAAFERLKPVRILFDNGAGCATPGRTRRGLRALLLALPAAGTQARSWFLAAGARCATPGPPSAGADTFTWDRRRRPPTDFTGNTRAPAACGPPPQPTTGSSPGRNARSLT